MPRTDAGRNVLLGLLALALRRSAVGPPSSFGAVYVVGEYW